MTISVEDVINGVSLYIPPGNALSDEQLDELAEELIEKHGDDDSMLGTIKCEFLKTLGYRNSVIDSINPQIRSEKLGKHSVSYGNTGGGSNWNNYIKQVGDVLCPMFGVETPYNLGTKVVSSNRKPVTPRCHPCDGYNL